MSSESASFRSGSQSGARSTSRTVPRSPTEEIAASTISADALHIRSSLAWYPLRRTWALANLICSMRRQESYKQQSNSRQQPHRGWRGKSKCRHGEMHWMHVHGAAEVTSDTASSPNPVLGDENHASTASSVCVCT